MLYYRGISSVSLNIEFVLFYSHIHFSNRKSGWSKFLGHLGIEIKVWKVQYIPWEELCMVVPEREF